MTLRWKFICTLATIAFALQMLAGTFTNGGFEDQQQAFNGWTQGAGWWYGGWPLNPVNYLPGGSSYAISANASTIVSVGPDPIVGNLLNQVYNGSYAARVNDSYNNYSVSVISQSVTNYTDPHIYFAWAAVLESSTRFHRLRQFHPEAHRRHHGHRVDGGHAGYVYLDGFGAAPPPQTTPEPGTLALLGTGVIGLAGVIRRKLNL